MTKIDARAVQALRLVRYRSGLTHYAITLVSRQARRLLDAGLIEYGSGRTAYVLTAAGARVLREHCDEPGCFAPIGSCAHSTAA